MSFIEIEHSADRAILVTETNLPDFFAEAARGMYSLMGIQTGRVMKTEVLKTVQPDEESLLVWFLSELLVTVELERLAVTRYLLTIENNLLSAEITFSEMTSSRSAIKAVTFSDLKIVHTPDGIQAVIVFDF